MAKLSKVDAAKAAGVSRQTLYTYIKDERLSVDTDGLVDTVELLRAGFTLHTGQSTGRQDLDAPGHSLTSRLDTLDVYRDMIDMLKAQLVEAQAREVAAREREATLLQMVQQLQQQNQRLLDIPRPAPLTRTAAPSVPVSAPRAPAAPGDPRGDMRRRIINLLQHHPEGLTPAEMRPLLGVDKSLADTCLGMRRYGLVQRVGRGRYVAAAPSQHHQP